MGRTARIRKKKHVRLLAGNNSVKLDCDSTLISLVKWLKGLGWEPSCALHPTLFPMTGRGLMAGRNISAGETLIQIPLEALITSKTVEQSDIGHIISKKALLSEELLTIFLVWENRKGSTSQWAPYIYSLPKEFSLPLFLPQNISLPDLLERPISEARNAAHKSFVRLKQLLPDLLKHEFKWAWSCVNTRAVYLPQKSSRNKNPTVHIMNRDCLALAPYLDLFNHSSAVSVDIKVTNFNYQILTNTSYKKHDQVFINYGPHANIKLFVEYGFAVPDNPHDALPLDEADFLLASGVKSSFDATVDAKMAFLRSQGLLNSAAFIRKGITWNAQAATKLLCCEDRNPRRWLDFVYNETETKLNKSALKNFANIALSQKSSFERSLDVLRQLGDSVPCPAVNACAYLISELRALALSAGVTLMDQAQL